MNFDDDVLINKLSNDELQHCFGFVGDYQYGFVARTLKRFEEDYLTKIGTKKRTSFRSVVESISHAQHFLAEHHDRLSMVS